MTSDFKFKIKFRVPSYILYQALTDESLITKYTQSKVNFPNKIGDKYSLYDGAMTGEIKELDENKKIVLTFKFNNWKDQAELKYNFKEAKGNECLLNVNLKNVPNRDIFNKTIEQETVKNGFYQQIFDRISTWLGYPQNKDESDEEED